MKFLSWEQWQELEQKREAHYETLVERELAKPRRVQLSSDDLKGIAIIAGSLILLVLVALWLVG